MAKPGKEIRDIAAKLRGPKKAGLQLIPITIVDRPDSIAPPSLGRRAVQKTASEWHKLPTSVQVIVSLTALVGALTPIILAIVSALR